MKRCKILKNVNVKFAAKKIGKNITDRESTQNTLQLNKRDQNLYFAPKVRSWSCPKPSLLLRKLLRLSFKARE